MSLVEGGDFQCYVHDFRAKDIKEWNEHMDDGTHSDEGSSTCVDCNTPIRFKVPYTPFNEQGSKGIREKYQLRCPTCSGKVGTAEVSTL